MRPLIVFTVRELSRRRITQVTLAMALAFLGVFYYLLSQQPHQSVEVNPLNNVTSAGVALVLGLFFCYFIVAFFAVLTTTGSVSGEIENGLLMAVMARPLKRFEVIAGKWVGIAVVQTVMVSVVVGGVLAILNSRFPGVVAAGWGLAATWALFVLQAWVLSALTLLCSVGLSAVASGVVMTMGFLMAFVFGSFAQLPHMGLSGPNLIAGLILPTDGLYRRAIFNALGPSQGLFAQYLGPFGARHVPSTLFVAYSGVYLLAALAVAGWWFRRRDL